MDRTQAVTTKRPSSEGARTGEDVLVERSGSYLPALPLLILASADSSKGHIVCDHISSPAPVQVFDVARDSERLFQSCHEDDKALFVAAVHLVQAYRDLNARPRDRAAKAKWKAAIQAYAQTIVAVRQREVKAGLKKASLTESNLAFGRWLIEKREHIGLDAGVKSPREALLWWDGDFLFKPEKADPELLISRAVSRHLTVGVSLGMWISEDGVRPAIYCGLPQAALAAKLLLGLGKGRGLAVCPYPPCGKVFEQKKRSDQEYCTIAHREAHRVARWRMTPKGRRALDRQAVRRREAARLRRKMRRSTAA